MLLVHQTGSVRVGELVRYTLTFTPSEDRILPTPPQLHVKVRNTSAIPLRAAYLHGPYTLYAACYPATFNPNTKHDDPSLFGYPQFEPNLKAGGSWNARLAVPESVRELFPEGNTNTAQAGDSKSVTWIIEVSSQVLFSTSATVYYEIAVARDEKSIDLGFGGLTGTVGSSPGLLVDHQQSKRRQHGQNAAQPKGLFSKAVTLVVEDTASLWNKPPLPSPEEGKLPEEDNHQSVAVQQTGQGDDQRHQKTRPVTAGKKRRVHLVVLTHGLHSNLGADMLYLKESIDAAAKQARLDVRRRKAKTPTSTAPESNGPSTSTAPLSGGQEDLEPRDDDDSDDEEVIVRGFSGNAIRTERGIQYLGKRLAKYVLHLTYPSQPYLPEKKSVSKSLSRAFSSHNIEKAYAGPQGHGKGSIHKEVEVEPSRRGAYRFTSISFIGHSLGGLTQTYAIAYIHKYSPEFFRVVKPINFIALATPFLGLSNENPLYVRFALDFGLVGRTGQDLGLTWRAPTVMRSGWEAMIAGIGTERQRAPKIVDPGSKPLLRLLPSGPAHQALRIFRHRTLYSNVVNDGIVPLRTSCMLFLDWRGLGRVEKARRENGLVGTMAGWGWAELTGLNSTERLLSARPRSNKEHNRSSSKASGINEVSNTPTMHGEGDIVPQPTEDATQDDNGGTNGEGSPGKNSDNVQSGPLKESPSPFAGLLALLRPGNATKSQHEPKNSRIYKRSQTIKIENEDEPSDTSGDSTHSRPGMARGDSSLQDPNNVFAPPKTSVFEAAGDLLNPPLPPIEYLIDPQSRPRTIFHDRIYHPEDIPPPPAKKGSSSRTRKVSSDDMKDKSSTNDSSNSIQTQGNVGGINVEEKIARAYHRDLSWRKVLVRLEPDAHNNIVVRRMFSNAYGWPVIKHLVDTHFADNYTAQTPDTRGPNDERAKPMTDPVGEHGEEVDEQPRRKNGLTNDEMEEATDELTDLQAPGESLNSFVRPTLEREDSTNSAKWTDRFFDETSEDDDDDGIYDSFTGNHESSADGGEVPKVHGNDVEHVRRGPEIEDGKPTSLPHAAGSGSKPLLLPVLSASSPVLAPFVGLRKSLEEQLN